MGIYLRGKYYYFKKQIQGKVYYRSLKIRKGQEYLLSARIKQIEEQILAEHFGIEYTPPKQITFLEFIKKYIEFKKYKKSLKLDKQRLKIITDCWGNPLLNKIDKRYIEKLENYLFEKKINKRQRKESTMNRYFALLKHFFNLAIKEGYMKENPVSKYYVSFVESAEKRALTQKELKKILKIARKIQENPKSYVQKIFYDLILFTLNTGMRLGEILNLKKKYIRDNLIFYPIIETKWKRRGSGKKKIKIICLNLIAQSIIQKQKSKDEYVFPLRNRNVQIIKNSIKQIRKQTGINDFSFHQLRHTVASLVSSEFDLVTAKTVLGHTDIKTTLRYAHPELQRQKEAVKKLEKIINQLNK